MTKELDGSLSEFTFCGLSVAPADSLVWSTERSHASCCALSLPNMRMPSVWHSTPLRPLKILHIPFWKCSLACFSPCSSAIPKWILFKHKHPAGCNLVSRQEAGERGICQKPLFVSSLLNSLAPDNLARVSFILGRAWPFHHTLWFSSFRSMLSHMPPDFFWATPYLHTRAWGRLLCRLLSLPQCD